MGKKATRSHASITVTSENNFIEQGILTYDEVCSFDYEDIQSLKADKAFLIIF